MRSRFLLFVLLAIVALLAVSGRRLLHAQFAAPAAPITVPPAQSFLVILGIGDKTATNWDGSIAVTGANIQIIRGWRFTGADSVSGGAWKLSTRTTPGVGQTGPTQENGVIVKVSEASAPITFNVTTTQGGFSFSSSELPFGVSKTFLNGRALVAQTGAQFQLSNSTEEEDFPAMAQSGDDVYLSYTEFVHGDRSQATGMST